ncbi:sensor histidine kinase [Micromonospora craniellae]|uniref:histidine kinase n=1 Tax=Micromonospora craniellae TaxID=2294034 RepID=A0A372G0B0_9ACTN|nr:ATP-binding protein [Micromonospora craniellae]QOC91470.1 nitrate- and nitrite sensing domain-containing protein [Micromonospora craniellae]RFS46206.1 sensor protein [Micromonospora craniellae]
MRPAGVRPPPDPGTAGSLVTGGGSIRTRLAAIVALPVVVVLIQISYVTVIEVSSYQAVRKASESVSLVLKVQDLTQELQVERGLSAALLGGNDAFRNEVTPARERVDERRRAVEEAIADGGPVADRIDAALRELDGLAVVRSATDSGSAERAATFDFFTERIASLNRLDYELDQATDPELQRHVATLTALNRIKESTAQQRAFLNGVFSAGGFAEGEFLQFAAMRAARDTALADFEERATPSQKAANDWVLDTGAARVAGFFEQVALDSADGRRVQVNPQAWWSSLTTVLDGMRHMQEYVGAEIEARAAERQFESTRRLFVIGVLVVFFLSGAVGLLLLASRSVTRPLAMLAAEARDLAANRLPVAVRQLQDGTVDSEPRAPDPVQVPARSSTEIRAVAGALDQVQAVAFRLATEQAVLRRSTTESLANLGRRNQNLLRRQLSFITKLEREETDPAGLANLFELDHLATRMRRNAESLLVLVGAGGPRQWTRPLAIADVIRAAISEVEEYRRVQIRRIDDAWVVGANVSAVAHMLAELVENGLTFSPPDSDVEIQGRRSGDGYLVAITDQGIGMSPEDLAEANARLRGEVDYVSAPTRYLGHHVVGQLARDLDIDVQLAPSPVTGVTARVLLPATVLTNPNAIAPDGGANGVGTTQTLTVAATTTRVAAEPTSAPVLPSVPAARPTPAVGIAGAGTRNAIDPPPARHAAPAAPRGYDRPVAGRPPTIAGEVSAVGPVEERTTNGLRKRLPRERRASEAAPAAGPVASAPRSDAMDDSPMEIRNRLTALRAGTLRGQVDRPAPPTRSSDDTTIEPWGTREG